MLNIKYSHSYFFHNKQACIRTVPILHISWSMVIHTTLGFAIYVRRSFMSFGKTIRTHQRRKHTGRAHKTGSRYNCNQHKVDVCTTCHNRLNSIPTQTKEKGIAKCVRGVTVCYSNFVREYESRTTLRKTNARHTGTWWRKSSTSLYKRSVQSLVVWCV